MRSYTLARLKQHLNIPGASFDAVLHVGDIAYDLRQNAGRTGDEFLADMEPVSSTVPYLTCPGNHERDCVDAHNKPLGSCNNPPYTNYRARFAMPTAAAGLHWSADIGYVHVISLNTDLWLLPDSSETQKEPIAAQLAWLEADLKLAAANRKRVPWIVAIGHEMLYTTHDEGHLKQAATLRAGGLEALFHRYGVDLYFSGHEHVYEHFARVYNSTQCTMAENCTAYIVVGNAGNREFPYRYSNGTIEKFLYPQPSYERFRSTSPAGFGLLDVNETAMQWRQLNAKSGTVIDQHLYTRCLKMDDVVSSNVNDLRGDDSTNMVAAVSG